MIDRRLVDISLDHLFTQSKTVCNWLEGHFKKLDELIKDNPNDADLGKAFREFWQS
jgi:hypothetical protein